jgi:hypothetical protein
MVRSRRRDGAVVIPQFAASHSGAVSFQGATEG